MKESATYQKILREGREEGFADGLAEGRAEGFEQGHVHGLAHGRKMGRVEEAGYEFKARSGCLIGGRGGG